MSLRSTFLKVLACVALAFAAFAPAKADPAPAANITFHYHRQDANYEKWGIHLWKSPNMPLDGVEWPNPMPPTGKDAYGVLWVRPADEFKTRTKMQVNYIIHKGDLKEQGGKDMVFNGLEHSEVWIYEGDARIYYSLDEVKAAHADMK
jgi:hypothetical protein